MKHKKTSKIIANVCLNAFDEYYEMSGGDCWVNKTPEYWYSVAIAKVLFKFSRGVTLENSVKEIRDTANVGGKRGTPKQAWRMKGKTDVALWKRAEPSNDDYWYPKAIIEVKRAWGWDAKTHGKDIDRICASLSETGKSSDHHGSIKYGMFVVVTDVASKDTKKETKDALRNKFEQLNGNIKEYLGDKSKSFRCKTVMKAGKIYENEGMPGIFIFTILLNERAP
jgi:Neuraminidase (sialidase)